MEMRKPILLLVFLCTLLLTGCVQVGTGTYCLRLGMQGQGTVEPNAVLTYAEPTLVSVSAVPEPGWSFVRWDGPVADPFAPETTVFVERDTTVQAIFAEDSAVEIALPPGGMIPRPPRPGGTADIEYIMLHAISDAAANPANPYEMDRIAAIFWECGVEAHYVIDRSGTAYQFVRDDSTARHAGRGSWAKDPRLTNNMNRYALGIEILGIGTEGEMAGVIGAQANSRISEGDRGFTDEQYAALNGLLSLLTSRYHIPADRIISHEEYDPGRKWDPGDLFEWERIRLQ